MIRIIIPSSLLVLAFIVNFKPIEIQSAPGFFEVLFPIIPYPLFQFS